MGTGAGQMTVNPLAARLINPSFAFATQAAAQPRETFSMPALISPVAAPTGETLFEEPRDPTKKHYLPAYSIATTPDGRSEILLQPIGKAFQLIVQLSETTTAVVSKSNVRIDAPTRYMLTAVVQDQFKTFDFGQVQDQGMLKLTLPIPDRPTMEGIFQAISDPEAHAKLILRRTVSLAVLGPIRPGNPAVAARAAVPAFPGRPAIHSGRIVLPAVAPRPAIPAVAARPATATLQLYVLNSVATIDTIIPFTFSKELDHYIFAQVETGPGSAQAPWTIVRIPWKQGTYPYYQRLTQPDQFLFLPDAFKIARNPLAHGSPMLTVQSNGQTADDVTLTLSYVAQPVWSQQRIDAAAAWLKLQQSSANPELALFDASNTALSLKLPAQDASAAPALVPQPAAQIQIAAGVKGSVSMKLGQFQQIYDALFDQVSDLFTGQVMVTVAQDAGPDVQVVPFTARAADFVGEIFQTTTSFGPIANQLTCVVRNAIESPIHVDSLPAGLTRAGVTILDAVEQIAPALPVDLVREMPVTPASAGTAPVTSLTVTLQLPAGQTADGSTSVFFDYSGTSVKPDAKAIWQAIMKNQVVGPVARPVTVKLLANVLAPPAVTLAKAPSTSTTQAAPANAPAPLSEDAVLAVQVEFEGQNKTANFENGEVADASGFLNQVVSLAVPIEQYVLHEGDTGTYRYRVNLITPHGKKTGDWTMDTLDDLFLQVN